MEAISSISARYAITHIIYHQGETDYAIGTSKQEYRFGIETLVQSIRAANVPSPFFISIATKCNYPWEQRNPISSAQKLSVNREKGIFLGVNTDELVQDIDRRDGCHFGATGQEKFAAALLDIFLRPEKDLQ